MGLTGVAMETMRPSGPVKLESIESGMYKEVGVTVSHVLEFRLKKTNSSVLLGQVSLKYSVCPGKVLDVSSFFEPWCLPVWNSEDGVLSFLKFLQHLD